MKPEILSTKLY